MPICLCENGYVRALLYIKIDIDFEEYNLKK